VAAAQPTLLGLAHHFSRMELIFQQRIIQLRVILPRNLPHPDAAKIDEDIPGKSPRSVRSPPSPTMLQWDLVAAYPWTCRFFWCAFYLELDVLNSLGALLLHPVVPSRTSYTHSIIQTPYSFKVGSRRTGSSSDVRCVHDASAVLAGSSPVEMNMAAMTLAVLL